MGIANFLQQSHSSHRPHTKQIHKCKNKEAFSQGEGD